MLKKAKAQAQADNEAAGDAQGKALADTVLESSRQIWLAGLGAFSRAQAEGGKLFDALVQQGQALESRTRQAATDTAVAAREAAQAKAKEMQAKAEGTWDKLEQVFEARVARALSRLGVHTQSDVRRLTERVDALSESVNDLIRATAARPPSVKATSRKRVAGKTATGAQGAKGAKRARKA
ncbi:MAG TPA: phasin family protein [Casimicrobiaceae bacterium]|jgi:poly(hydroxyalkanoate) granule-associated protein|nr:phasin family protein [Casimicrobiaceae bacterium]